MSLRLAPVNENARSALDCGRAATAFLSFPFALEPKSEGGSSRHRSPGAFSFLSRRGWGHPRYKPRAFSVVSACSYRYGNALRSELFFSGFTWSVRR